MLATNDPAGRPVRPDLLFRVATMALDYDGHSELEPEDETAAVRGWAVLSNGLPALVAPAS